MIVTQGSAVLDVYAVFCTELHKLRYSKNCLCLSLIQYATRLAVTICCKKPTRTHERCAECSLITKNKPHHTYMHEKTLNPHMLTVKCQPFH